MEHIGKSIRGIIERERVTLYRIAKDLGINQANLHRSLRDDANPEWSTIEKVLDYLGYDYKLFKRKEVKPIKSKPPRSRRNLKRR